MSDFVKSLIKDIIVAAILAAVVISFVRPTIVKQTSMQDTLNPNDYIIMYRRAYSGDKEPKRGDIVIFKSELQDENGKNKLLIKRVIGLPGDKITINDGKVYVNDKEYDESYLKDGYTTGSVNNFKVPKGEYFVMGDNRVVSIDSRYSEVGCIKKDAIKGRAVLRLFPFTKIKKL
ncbi:signal peptidase I [Mogibacterium diversum]|jgi:signal peptidase I|uniref:signal peptidase I n=1 Tax=Mogibacterium diversum TaxID=114527 RepID=UPI001CAAD16F|nr:signal peptidase I [Mogibacterium diversum]MBF1319570.1 signal peptidase I [Mogibacterium diversum]